VLLSPEMCGRSTGVDGIEELIGAVSQNILAE
jgi:hypothetical protein